MSIFASSYLNEFVTKLCKNAEQVLFTAQNLINLS